jgi:hypothetical protein
VLQERIELSTSPLPREYSGISLRIRTDIYALPPLQMLAKARIGRERRGYSRICNGAPPVGTPEI